MLPPLENTLTLEPDWAALAIQRDGRHCGILFRSDDVPVLLLHLAWDYSLLHEPAGPDYFSMRLAAGHRDQRYVAGLCEAIARLMPPIPYGLDPGTFEFDRTTGALSPGETGKGMTCASFILIVFKGVGLAILQEDEWPLNQNDGWQSWVVENLRKGGTPADRMQVVEGDIGCRRFTPTEVVASSAMAPWPVSLAIAQTAAADLLERLSISRD